MRHLAIRCVLIGAAIITLMWAGSPVKADTAVVHAVLFYRPDCPHCHVVMTEVLPPLREQYGDRLVIAELDTTTAQGNAVWKVALERYDLARGDPPQTGVPALIIGEHNLVGSEEIPAQLPALVEAYLAEGGVDWPDLPGLEGAASSSSEVVQDDNTWATVWARYTRDLAGNILSTIVLVGLVGTMVAVLRRGEWQLAWARRFGSSGMVIVTLVGLGVAVYLAYVEMTGTAAVCGPVGDCNTVQQSRYALLFGFLPVAVFGVIGYVAILVGYVYTTWIKGKGAEYVPALIFVLALFGLAFSIYLTFLEPFVIGATCAWCLTSSMCMMVVALSSAGPGWAAIDCLAQDWRLTRSN